MLPGWLVKWNNTRFIIFSFPKGLSFEYPSCQDFFKGNLFAKMLDPESLKYVRTFKSRNLLGKKIKFQVSKYIQIKF